MLLPSTLTHIAAFASLNKDILAPQDTITAIVKTADGAHGTFELTFASPSSTNYTDGNGLTITGSHGWLNIGQSPAQEGKPSQSRITINTVSDKQEVKEEIIDVASWQGVNVEIASFFQAVDGNDDRAQDPSSALKDLAFIQAALRSNGQSVDLAELAQI